MPRSIISLCHVIMMVGLILTGTLSSSWALSDREVRFFVDSLSAVDNLATQMERNGKMVSMRPETDMMPGKDFSPYMQAVTQLQTKYPDYYEELENIVERYDFSNPQVWASTGDKVMKAYMAHELSAQGMPEDMDFMKGMTPEMMAMIPPEAKAQMEASQKMVQSIQDVPEADKAALKPHLPALKAWMAAQ